MIALALVGLTSAPAMAQDTEVPVKKYSVATNSFWANWFVSAGITGNAYYSSQEAHGMSGNPFSDKRGTLGFTVALGKWHTPGIGFRTKFDAMWGKQVNSDDSHPLFNSFNIHEDVLFNLSNLFCGYNEKRVWNTIVYPGIGAIKNADNDDHNWDISYHLGWLNNFRVSSRFQIFADINLMFAEGSHDAGAAGWANYKKGECRYWDKRVSLNIGVTYNIGKHTWDKVPDVDALMAMNKEQMDALNQSLKEQQDENARLRDMLAAAQNKPAQVIENNAKEVVSSSASVFFDINSAKVASRKDLVNVKELAEYAKNNNSKILVTGYADSKTGSAEYNQKLSEQRAQTVADELVKMGVNRDNIITEAKGGVDQLSPFSYNRRATVKVQ